MACVVHVVLTQEVYVAYGEKGLWDHARDRKGRCGGDCGGRANLHAGRNHVHGKWRLFVANGRDIGMLTVVWAPITLSCVFAYLRNSIIKNAKIYYEGTYQKQKKTEIVQYANESGTYKCLIR